MSNAKHNPPPILRKQGILRAVDNIGPDQQLQVPASILWAFFGPELRARYIRPRAADDSGSLVDD